MKANGGLDFKVNERKVRGLCLLSGGLDSTLALRVIHDQGVEVHAVHFSTGFCLADASARARRPEERQSMQGGPSDAFSVAEKLGVPIKLINISDGYLDILHHPRYGYGKNVNPCVDCRIHMFSIAKWLMEEEGAEFVFTGEVLGQRPKSQHLEQLTLIARRSGLEDRLLRPLSALLLPETLPERMGWVDRSRLFGFHGRTRKPQMALAQELGLNGYPQPAGGCCTLTDPSYARKVKDMWAHGTKDEMDWEDYLLLRVGRHLRVHPGLKVVVGRHQTENAFLDNYRKGRVRLEPVDVKGPVVLIDGTPGEEDEIIAARIAARYSDVASPDDEVTLRVERDGEVKTVRVKPFKPEEVSRWVIA